MNIGKLRHQINIQSSSGSKDSFGDVSDSWSTDSTVWASVDPLNGRELEHALQIHSEVQYKITIRYDANIDARARILWGTRTFEILSIIKPKEINEMMFLYCKEIV
jgi:SPP1 family predicted phage head-tail adaptor